MVDVFTCLEDADDALVNHEVNTNTKFVLVARTKSARAVIDIESLDGYTVKFEDLRGCVPIQYNGIPFIMIGTEVRECHYGPRRKKKPEGMKREEDHCYTSSRRQVQVSKKLGCTAKVQYRMILRFPDFKLEGHDTKRRRKDIITGIKAMDFKLIRSEYQVLMVIGTNHHDHLVGEEAAYGLPVDRRVAKKIKELVVVEGVQNAKDIKCLIDTFSKSLYSGPLSNRRFFPTMQDVRNHIGAAMKSNQYSADDQENVKSFIKAWKEAGHSDKHFHFQHMSITDDGIIKPLLFVHQTKWQQELLVKYGNDMVLMDGTYKITKYDISLYFMCVAGNVGYFVVATFILGHESRQNIEDALALIRDWNSNWHPKAFMCDMDHREIVALENVFKGSSVFVCTFHREQAWTRWLRKGSNNAKHCKAEVQKQLREIARSVDQEEMEGHIRVLEESVLYTTNGLFRRWINRIWLANKERWVRCYRTSPTEVHITTTNGVESIHKVLKTKYLRNMGSTKNLSRLICLLVEKFAPDDKDRYIQGNVMASEKHRKYNETVPIFLRNRPKPFIEHCLRRWNKIEEILIQETESGFVVSGYYVDMEVPSCACPDFRATGWPCKHLLAVCQYYAAYSWEFLPERYTTLPCFNLDLLSKEAPSSQEVQQPVSECSTDPIMFEESKQIRASLLEKVSELNTAVYSVDSKQLLCLMDTRISNLLEDIRNTNLTLKPVKPKCKRTQKYEEQPAQPETPKSNEISFEDEISKVLSDIWSGEESEDAIVEVGPYTIRNNSFHYILHTLSDEVIDACLHSLCNSCQNALHISCVVMTAIFVEPTPSAHGFLSQEILNSFDVLVGAVNENNNHWTLLIVKPKEKKVFYMNPMGETRRRMKHLLRNWCKLLRKRQADGDTLDGDNWTIHTVPHAKQFDGVSCGVYVLKFAELWMANKSLVFDWSREDITAERLKIARTLLAEGGPVQEVERKCDSPVKPQQTEPGCESKTKRTSVKRKSSSFVYENVKKSTRRYCVCGKKNDQRLYWQCEECSLWFHPDCINLDPKKEPPVFICPQCKENDSDLDEEERMGYVYLFSKPVMKKLIHIGLERVKHVISGTCVKEPWMKRHNQFLKESTNSYGYGYSYFSISALQFLEVAVMKQFFTDKTEKLYTRHGLVIGMNDKKLLNAFKKDKYLAKEYVKQVMCKEGLAAIMAAALSMSYNDADSELSTTESKLLSLALDKSLCKVNTNREEWQQTLVNFLKTV